MTTNRQILPRFARCHPSPFVSFNRAEGPRFPQGPSAPSVLGFLQDLLQFFLVHQRTQKMCDSRLVLPV